MRMRSKRALVPWRFSHGGILLCVVQTFRWQRRDVYLVVYVVSRLLTGLETLVINRVDAIRLEKAASSPGGKCMKGKAFKQCKLVDNQGEVVAGYKEPLANAQVLQHWRQAGVAEEWRT